MFGWLKGKLNNEAKKLYYQNKMASLEMSDIFGDEYGAEQKDLLLKFIYVNEAIFEDWPKKLSHPEMECLLKMNKDLRNAYTDQVMSFCTNSFDDRYQPPDGWVSYYKQSGI